MPSTVLYTVCYSDFYGTQRNILATARKLDPERFTPLVAAPGGEMFFSELKKENIPVVEMPFTNVADTGTIIAIRRLINQNNVAIIHAHLGISTFLSLAASTVADGVPVISTRHFIEDRYSTLRSRLKYTAYLNMYKR
nr:glycosyltransferase family 4 protein [bacterium]